MAIIRGVPKIFDDLLVEFVQLAQDQNWTTLPFQLGELETDATAERHEKAADERLRAQFEAHHQQYLKAHSERYQRFLHAVDIVRTVYKDREDVQQLLKRFTRRTRPKAKPENSTPT